MDEEFWSNLLEQTMQLFINPEIERRLADDRMDSSSRLFAAQVVMNVGEPVEVRLNQEISGVFRATLPGAKEEDIGTTVSLAEFERIEAMELLPSDENAGHITVVLYGGKWFIDFDLRYNRGRILEYLAVADQFLETARDSLNMSRYRPFVENLLAATEHLARCYLLPHGDEALIKKNTSHRMVQTRFNQWSKFGNVDQEYVQLLNRLFALRLPARYLTAAFDLSCWEADELLASARRLRSAVESSLPPRYTRRLSA